MNLNNPMDLRIHQQLLNINLDAYKSKNNYMVRKLYQGIFGEGNGLEEIKVETQKADTLISREELEDMEKRITEKVMNKVMKTLFDMVCDKGEKLPEPSGDDTEEDVELIDESIADVALGYFDED
ncbi:MAG: hypothetical protein ACI4EE_10205 [Lachnospiraceae bacterium]